MKRRMFLMMIAMFPWIGASAIQNDGAGNIDVRGIGLVIEHELAQGASNKEGLQGVTDAGAVLFASSTLNPRNKDTGTYAGATIPRWVRVTWREGMTAYLTDKSGQYATGKVVGDYTVQVLSRIPKEAFELARAGKKRFLVLSFRIRDDGVDFGWMVRLQDGVPFEALMKGGDF